ncbi:hypothetical protein [Runella zeae]|uniref:hypothetical protein n=1 Tax=Runella zeae TaxID=94255 RepID=UPI00146F20B3|nr:hypothetical protein [Runella zeae]
MELKIDVSAFSKPWLMARYQDKLLLTPNDLVTEKLYWMAQCEKLSMSVSDRRPHMKYTQSMSLELEAFHGSRWNKFSVKNDLKLFNYTETRLWMIFVETLIRQDLYGRMAREGITKGYHDFIETYQYEDEVDYEREVRTYNNHRRSGELLKWQQFKI